MTNAVSARRYLAAYLPHLSAERSARANATPPDAAFALVEKERGAMRIAALSPAAQGLGLTPGMALADARARVPELAAYPHDPAADAALLDHIAEGCDRYTPMVAVRGRAGVVLDLTGVPCASDIMVAVARDLAMRLVRQGLSARFASAATPDAAHALARFNCTDVCALPIAALDLDDGAATALRRAGLHDIGALADRPRAPLAARFGTELPVRLARLLGEEDPRITPRRTPPAIQTERRFAEPMLTTAPLLGVIGELAAEAAATLAERGEGGRRFGIALYRVDGDVARLAVDTGIATRDPKAIARLFDERLDALADPLDPGFGYDMLRFAVLASEPLGDEQPGLAEDADRTPDLAPLLDRLGIRFGAGAIRRFHPRDEHFPEYAAATRPLRGGPPRLTWHRPDPGEPPLRPLALFDPPQPITVLAEVPDGPPRNFRWRGQQHRIARAEGPERIAYPWWKHPAGHGPTRDYYRVEDEHGHRFWVFRHGLFEENGTPGWYLHGLFA